MKLRQIRKALVPLVISGVLSLLAMVGVHEGMTVGDAVAMVITAGAVWAIPNDPS